ncbi:MAG: hypothetical protein JWM22_1373 [Frankiales bacterium]|nr:hypothetical protein [Frankiales bacterium]
MFASDRYEDVQLVWGHVEGRPLMRAVGVVGGGTMGAGIAEVWQLYAPPPLLLRMCEAGLLGPKSGQGFFAYG